MVSTFLMVGIFYFLTKFARFINQSEWISNVRLFQVIIFCLSCELKNKSCSTSVVVWWQQDKMARKPEKKQKENPIGCTEKVKNGKEL